MCSYFSSGSGGSNPSGESERNNPSLTGLSSADSRAGPVAATADSTARARVCLVDPRKRRSVRSLSQLPDRLKSVLNLFFPPSFFFQSDRPRRLDPGTDAGAACRDRRPRGGRVGRGMSPRRHRRRLHSPTGRLGSSRHETRRRKCGTFKHCVTDGSVCTIEQDKPPQARRLLAGLSSPSPTAFRLTAIDNLGPPAAPSSAAAAAPAAAVVAGEKLRTGAKPALRDDGSGVPLISRGEPDGKGSERIGMSAKTGWALPLEPGVTERPPLRDVEGGATTGLPLPLTFFSIFEMPPRVLS